jgi:hypothetical protein
MKMEITFDIIEDRSIWRITSNIPIPELLRDIYLRVL